MDADGFDPYEDEYDWRDRLETMGEQFQEQLKAKGITRRLPQRNYGSHAVMGEDGLFRAEPILPGTVIRTADGGMRMFTDGEWKPYSTDPPSVTAWLEDGVVADDDLPRKFVECPACRGAGGAMMNNGDWEECDECRGTGEIPNPQRPLFKFTGF